MMDKRLVKALLRIFHSTETRFDYSKGLAEFSDTYNVGRKRGASLYFEIKDKREIGTILHQQMGIDVDSTLPDSWDGLGRSAGLMIGNNEKFARAAVNSGRLQLKSLPCHPLSVCGGQWTLPARAEMGVDLTAVLSSPIGHDSLLVVENGETFQSLWDISFENMEGYHWENPLAVYRGDTGGGSRADAVNALISSVNLPVFAFVDFDPAGMVIAATLPRLTGLITPPPAVLSKLMNTHGLIDRFMDQIGGARNFLEQREQDPVIGQAWSAIRSSGKALPQEFFHRKR